jgi:hypothetical protein
MAIVSFLGHPLHVVTMQMTDTGLVAKNLNTIQYRKMYFFGLIGNMTLQFSRIGDLSLKIT